jgi:hypothetical protein
MFIFLSGNFHSMRISQLLSFTLNWWKNFTGNDILLCFVEVMKAHSRLSITQCHVEKANNFPPDAESPKLPRALKKVLHNFPTLHTPFKIQRPPSDDNSTAFVFPPLRFAQLCHSLRATGERMRELNTIQYFQSLWHPE